MRGADRTARKRDYMGWVNEPERHAWHWPNVRDAYAKRPPGGGVAATPLESGAGSNARRGAGSPIAQGAAHAHPPACLTQVHELSTRRAEPSTHPIG